MGTFLERLSDWIQIYSGSSVDVPMALRAGVDLVLVDRVWNFAATEIARQLGKPAAELLRPNREAIEAAFFAEVTRVCAAARRKRRRRD